MVPNNIPISLVRGDNGIFKFTVTETVRGKSKPVDLSTYDEIAMAIEVDENTKVYALVDFADTDNNLAKGIFYIKIPTAVTDDFPEEESIDYDIQFKDPDFRKTIVKGSIAIISDINKT